MVSSVSCGMGIRSISFSTWKSTVRLERRAGPGQRWFSTGFRWVICAYSEDPGYNPFPLKFLARIGLTDLSEGSQPDNRDAEFEQISATASQAFLKLNEGGILVHCVGERGRTGTIIGAILRHCGYGATEVTDFLNAAYVGAGRPKGCPRKSVAIGGHRTSQAGRPKAFPRS
jgi:hypothetical protein